MTYCLNPHCPRPENPDTHRFCQSCGESLRLGDRYEAAYPVGSGENSRTFMGRDRATLVHPQCLIKQFTPMGETALARAAAAERWRRDAELWAIAGQHPQVPDLQAVFERDEQQYLVQQFLVGPHLDNRLQEKGGPFDSAEVLALLRDVLPILHHLHSHQIIHRDIKPTNLRCPLGQSHWWLVDLGVIKPLTATRLAKPGTLVGNAAYAAPEQLRGEATYASDIYSLGVVCLHLLTGLQPFDLFDGANGCWHWRSIVPDVSLALAAVLEEMVQLALRDRLPTVAEVMTRLAIPVPGAGGQAQPQTLPPVPAPWPVQTTVQVASDPRALAVSRPAASLLVLTATGTVEVRSLAQPATLHQTLSLSQGDPVSLAAHPQQSAFGVSTRQGGLEQWALAGTVWHRQTLSAVPPGVTQMIFDPTGTVLILADAQGQIHRVDWATGTVKATGQGHQVGISSLALSRQGTVLASGDVQGQVKLWSWPTMTAVRTFSRQPGAITALAWLAQDRALVTAGWDVTLRWRCPHSGRILYGVQAQGFTLPIRSLLAHPTEPDLVTGSQDGQVLYWRCSPEHQQSLTSLSAIAAAAPLPAPILYLCCQPAAAAAIAQVLSLSETGCLLGRSWPPLTS